MRLTIITITLALAGLTACGPLTAQTPLQHSPVVNVREATITSGECTPAREGECAEPRTGTPIDPNAPCVPEGGTPCYEGGVPVPTTTAVPPPPYVCVPGEVEGGPGGVTC